MSDQQHALRLQRRLWITIFAVVAFFTLVLGYLQYCSEKNRSFDTSAKSISVVGMLKATEIAEWRRERLADAIRYAQGPGLIAPTRAFLQNPSDPASRSNTLHMLTLNRKSLFYQNTILVSTNGAYLLSAVPLSDRLSPASQTAARKALLTREPVLSGIFSDFSSAHLDTAAPICDASGEPLAVLLLRAHAAESLYPLIRFWPTENSSAETLLLEREGDSVVFLNETRHRTGSIRNMRLPLKGTRSIEVDAALGARGIIRGKDYRNVEVLAEVRPVPESTWLLATKLDQREVLAEVGQRARIIALFVGLSILLTGSLTAFGYRRNQAGLYRDLYRFEREQRLTHEKFRTILYSIGDAVIVTDDHGCIRQMNRVAEDLTGWREAEALDKPLDEVFRIISEETRIPADNPVWRVLRDGQIVGLANHTVLISRDGTERPIADSGAPIRYERSSLSGVVLIFRDQTAERAAQKALAESEAQYRDLFLNMTEGFALHEIICDAAGKPSDYLFLRINPAFERLTGLEASRIVGRRVLEVLPETEPHWIQVYGAVALGGKAVQFERFSAALKRHYRIAAFCPRPGQFCTIFSDITERKQAALEQAKLVEQLQHAQRLEAVGRLAGGVAHDFNNMLAVIVSCTELAVEKLAYADPVRADLDEVLKASMRSADLVKHLLAFASKQSIAPCVLNLNDTISGMINMLSRLIGEAISLEWRPGPDLWTVTLDPCQIDQIIINLTVNARDAISGAGQICIETRNVSADALLGECPAGTPPGNYVLLAVSDDGCGMNAETQAHIFEPFFTTKGSGVGIGLGLSTVYGIVKQNRGFICLSSEPNKGARFSIYLPSDTKPASACAIPHDERPSDSHRQATILLVEDEPALLSLTATLLRKMGYTVLAASGSSEAIRMSSEHPGMIDLLMTDIVMPEMSGRVLRDRLVIQRPTLKCLYMSGYTADVIAHHGVLRGNIHFLQKPFSREALATQLHAILNNA